MMWAAQLRNYRQKTEKTCQKETASRCVSDTEVGSTGGFSLYSSGAEEAGGKDLDKCAQLLSEMMQAAPGLLTRPSADPKGSRILAGKVKKGVKPGILTKSRKVAERGPKSAVTRKPATKVTAKSKEHAIDSVSETSTELQVRLAGPKPLPLNNSETVVRVTGIQPDTGPHFQPGQVVMTKVPTNVPYNNRILSSTPMSSPSAPRHRAAAAYSLHSDSGASIRNTTDVTHNPGQMTSTHAREGMTGKTSVGNNQQPHLSDSRSGGRSGDPLVNAQLIDVMKQYITQSDDNLTSFIQSCLSRVTPGGSQGHHQGQGLHQGQPQLQSQGQSHYASNASYSGLQTQDLNTAESHRMPQSELPAEKFTNSAPSGLYMTQKSQSNPSCDVDIDAILKTHGAELSRSQSATEPKLADWTGTGQSAEFGKENLPPYLDSRVTSNMTDLGADNTEVESTEAQPHTDHSTVVEEVAQQPRRDKTKSKASHRTKSPTAKTGKKDKEQCKKKAVRITTEKPSPADTKTQVRTLLYQFGELRAVTSLSRDREVGRLLTDMEQTLTQLTPGLATSSLSTDIDLALQPLRSENAQLRRRMRILNQQFKDKCYAVDEACKPDPNVQVIELELQKHSLETKLQEEVTERERLQAAVTTLAQQIQGLMKERQNMLKVISAKETDNVRSQQDWISEAGVLRAQLQTAEKQRTELRTQLEEVSQEKLLVDVTLKQRTKENDRLRELVKSLQGSMSRLLEDLKGTKPRQSAAVDDISRYIESIGNLLKTNKPAETPLDTKPTRDTIPQTFTPSVPPVSAPPMSGLLSSLLGNAPPFVGQLQDLIRSVPAPTNDPTGDEVQDGLQRAYQLLDRIDDAITPRQAKSPERKLESKPLTKPQGGHPEPKRPRSTERANEVSPQRRKDYPQVTRHENHESWRKTPVKVHSKGSPVDFDPDNDNYQGQLTQELLQEHDRQNGVDNDVIERMLVRSTRSQDQEGQKQSQFSQKQTTSSSLGMSKKSMFTLPKDMDDDPSSLEEHEIRLSLDKLPTVPTTDSDGEKRSGFSSPYDMDTTEYLNPPEDIKKRGSVLKQQQNPSRQPVSGLTVRELLGPLAERIMHSPAAKRVPSYTLKNDVSSPPSSKLSAGTLSSDTDLQGGEGDTDGDDTLTLEDQDINKIQEDQHKRHLSMNDSDRYSVSDYFMKYPASLPPGTASVLTTDRSASLAPPLGASLVSKSQEKLRDNSSSTPQVVPDMVNSDSTSFTTVTSVGSAAARPAPQGAIQHSPQDRLYRGTELDTSLSTIQEAESNSVLSSSSVTSVSSLATVDEQDFKDGLAKLDENIARIQSSLKTQIGGYF